MIDLPATLLEFFGGAPAGHAGHPLRDALASGAGHREACLFGVMGAHVNVTDGRYVYMRPGQRRTTRPLRTR